MKAYLEKYDNGLDVHAVSCSSSMSTSHFSFANFSQAFEVVVLSHDE